MPAGFDAEVAELFRDLRLAANLDESQLADRLDTQVEVVQALEQGTLYALPPWPETSRVVSAYGRLLNLDVQPLLRRVYAQVEAGVIPEEMPSDSTQTLDFSGSDPYDSSDPYDLGSEAYEFERSPDEEPAPQGASNGLYPDEASPYGEQGGMQPPPPRPQPQPNYGHGGGPRRPMPPQGAPRQQGPQGQPQGQPPGQRPPQGVPDPRSAARPMGPGGQAPGQFAGQRPQQPPRPGGPPPQYRPPPGAPQGRPHPGGQFRPQHGGAPPPPGAGQMPQPGQGMPPPPPPQDAVWPEAEYAPPPEAEFPGTDDKKAGRLKKAIAMIVIVLAAIFVLWLLFSQVGSLFGTAGGPQEEIGQNAEPPGGDTAAPEESLDPNDPQNRKSDRLPVPEMPQ